MDAPARQSRLLEDKLWNCPTTVDKALLRDFQHVQCQFQVILSTPAAITRRFVRAGIGGPHFVHLLDLPGFGPYVNISPFR